MIISHIHRYVFVELPLTGTTAISRELCINYDGYPILSKHATYNDFTRIANTKERAYFTFSCIRNPMDQAVSRYFKLKTNQYGKFTDPSRMQHYQKIVRYIFLNRFKYIHKVNADFASYFMKYYRLPYNNWSCLSHKEFDFIIRFERIDTDFAKVIAALGLELKRGLPRKNITPQRKREFSSYYTPETIERAKYVFGPFTKEWGYEFPREWGSYAPTCWNHVEFKVVNTFRILFWKYLRNRIKDVL